MTYKPYIGKEEKFQQAVKKYLDSLGVLWFHPPNEIKSKVSYLKKRASLGVKSGISDVIILEARHGYHGLFIELKAGKNKPTANQIEFLKRAESNDYKAIWSNSLDEVMSVVEEYLK